MLRDVFLASIFVAYVEPKLFFTFARENSPVQPLTTTHNEETTSVGARAPAPYPSLGSLGYPGHKAGARRGSGSMEMCPDDDLMAAAQLALRFERRMPASAARAAFEGLLGAKVVR